MSPPSIVFRSDPTRADHTFPGSPASRGLKPRAFILAGHHCERSGSRFDRSQPDRTAERRPPLRRVLEFLADGEGVDAWRYSYEFKNAKRAGGVPIRLHAGRQLVRVFGDLTCWICR